MLRVHSLLPLILLLLLCDASEGCVDSRGRPGRWESYEPNCLNGLCPAVAYFQCVIPDLPPRLTHEGLWECDEFYELTGARFSWPGGVFAVQPEKCRPVVLEEPIPGPGRGPPKIIVPARAALP